MRAAGTGARQGHGNSLTFTQTKPHRTGSNRNSNSLCGCLTHKHEIRHQRPSQKTPGFVRFCQEMFGNRTPKVGSCELGETHVVGWTWISGVPETQPGLRKRWGQMGHCKGNPSCDRATGAGLGAGSAVLQDLGLSCHSIFLWSQQPNREGNPRPVRKTSGNLTSNQLHTLIFCLTSVQCSSNVSSSTAVAKLATETWEP